MINSVHEIDGYWLCKSCSTDDSPQLTPDSEFYCGSCGKSRYGANINIGSITKPTQKPKTAQKRDLSIVSGVLSAESEKTAFLSVSEYMAKYSKSSKTEYDRYCYLWSLADRGIIHDFECQPEYELNPRIVVEPTKLFPNKVIQSREIYTADFRYRIDGYTIVEDVKGGKIKGTKRQLKPYVKTAARNKHKSLIAIWHQQHKLANTRLLFTVWYGKEWHYFNSNQNEIAFSLETLKGQAA